MIVALSKITNCGSDRIPEYKLVNPVYSLRIPLCFMFSKSPIQGEFSTIWEESWQVITEGI